MQSAGLKNEHRALLLWKEFNLHLSGVSNISSAPLTFPLPCAPRSWRPVTVHMWGSLPEGFPPHRELLTLRAAQAGGAESTPQKQLSTNDGWGGRDDTYLPYSCIVIALSCTDLGSLPELLCGTEPFGTSGEGTDPTHPGLPSLSPLASPLFHSCSWDHLPDELLYT